MLRGLAETVTPTVDLPSAFLIKKGQEKNVSCSLELAEDLEAPVYEGQVIGSISLVLAGEEIARYDVHAAEAVGRLKTGNAFMLLLEALLA